MIDLLMHQLTEVEQGGNGEAIAGGDQHHPPGQDRIGAGPNCQGRISPHLQQGRLGQQGHPLPLPHHPPKGIQGV
jgi:hypothetical protein